MPHFFRRFVEIGSLKNFFSEYFCLLVLYLDFLSVLIFCSLRFANDIRLAEIRGYWFGKNRELYEDYNECKLQLQVS